MPRRDLKRDREIGEFATHQPGKVNENSISSPGITSSYLYRVCSVSQLLSQN